MTRLARAARWILAPLAVSAAFSAASCVPPGDALPVGTEVKKAAISTTPDPALVAAGQSKYYSCGGCHGADAKGKGSAPGLAGMSFDKLKTGLQKPAMSAFKNWSDDDIKALEAYLASLGN